MHSMTWIPVVLGLIGGSAAPARDGTASLDLYVTAPGREDRLLRAADGVLLDVTVAVGLAGNRDTRQALWGDLDGDGQRDLVLVGHGGGLRLFRNGGEAGFDEATATAGLAGLTGIRAAEARDFDADGRTDLVLAHEDGLPRILRGIADGTFAGVDLGVVPEPGPGVRPLGTTLGAGVSAPVPERPAHEPAADPGPRSAGERTREPRTTSFPAPGGSGLTAADPATPGPDAMSNCAETIREQDQGSCLYVWSAGGAIGVFYPLSEAFNVDPAGNVGMGTTTPAEKLHVVGETRVEDAVRVYVGSQHRHTLAGRDVTMINSAGLLSAYYGVLLDQLGGYMTLQDPGFPGVKMTGDYLDTAGGGLSLASGPDDTVTFVGDGFQGGAFEMWNDQGEQTINFAHGNPIHYLRVDTVTFQDEGFGDAGSVSMRTSSSATSVQMNGLNSSGGGGVGMGSSISLRDAGVRAIDLLGDTGILSDCGDNFAGCIELWDHGTLDSTLFVSARDSVGTGAEMLLRDQDGTVTVDMDGQNGSTAQFALRETDGSTAFQMIGNTLRLYNASGTVTQTYDRITGSKSAVLATANHGLRAVYMVESPEVWLEDFGGGRLVDGSARVDIDPLFLETLTVDDEHPLEVQVTAAGRTSGLWVEKGADHFVVRELPGGPGHTRFDWRAMGRRRSLEHLRLDPAVDPLDDPLVATDPDALAVR